MPERQISLDPTSMPTPAEVPIYDHLDVVRAASMGDGGCPNYGNADVVAGKRVLAPVELVSRKVGQAEARQNGH